MNRKLCRVISILLILALLLPVAAMATQEVPDMEDVSRTDWFYPYVTHSFHFGLTVGTSADAFRFEPNRPVTRAEFVTMLGRLHEYDENNTIAIPPDGTFYGRYLAWAAGHGLILGDGYGDLMPHALITREQMAVIVYRYILMCDEMREMFENTWGIFPPRFADINEVSPWATGAVFGLNSFALLQGTNWSEGMKFQILFLPQDNATRAEVLAILVRVGSRVHDYYWGGWEDWWNENR